MIWFARCPLLRRPRYLRPALVSPRHSRCLWVGFTIQLIFGSLRMRVWLGSTRMTSKYLKRDEKAGG